MRARQEATSSSELMLPSDSALAAAAAPSSDKSIESIDAVVFRGTVQFA